MILRNIKRFRVMVPGVGVVEAGRAFELSCMTPIVQKMIAAGVLIAVAALVEPPRAVAIVEDPAPAEDLPPVKKRGRPKRAKAND